jgi:hypothetical protein
LVNVDAQTLEEYQQILIDLNLPGKAKFSKFRLVEEKSSFNQTS